MKCFFCQAEGASKRCSKCKTTWYCNQECQQKHWMRHKFQCYPPFDANETCVDLHKWMLQMNDFDREQVCAVFDEHRKGEEGKALSFIIRSQEDANNFKRGVVCAGIGDVKKISDLAPLSVMGYNPATQIPIVLEVQVPDMENTFAKMAFPFGRTVATDPIRGNGFVVL